MIGRNAPGYGDIAANVDPPRKNSRFHGYRNACLMYALMPVASGTLGGGGAGGAISDELRRSVTEGRSLIPRARRRLERLDHVADLEHDLHEVRLPLHLLRREVRRGYGELLEDRPRRRGEHVRPIT